MSTAPRHLPSGAHVGRFVVERVLGSGGMGVVYEGTDPDLDRRVAIKLLRTERTGHGERLLREAQALAQLSHPNVVAVYEIGVHDGQVFIAMERVDGDGLDRLMAGGPLPWRRALDLFVQAGRGLVAAHRKGIVHRDFKPSNVLVDRDGRVRVADFGLARLVSASSTDAPVARLPGEAVSAELAATVTDGGSSPDDPCVRAGGGMLGALLTDQGAVLGTPRYMAPEQHDGLAATEQWDQYSFCLVLWEALHGAAPFAGADVAALAAGKRSGRIVRPPESPRPPGWLVALVERGLAPAPADRFPSMATLIDRLEHTPGRRRRAALGAAVALGVAIAAGGGFAIARDARRPGCARADASIARAWTPAVRDRIARALGPAAEPVLAAIDARTGGWRTARIDACRATHDRREQTPALLDRRAGCFDRNLIELSSLVAVIDDGGVPAWRALEAARALPDAERCSAAALADATPAPAGPRTVEVARLIADTTTANRLGRGDEARAVGARAVAAARALGEAGLLAEALRVDAEAVRELDEVAGRALLEEALGHATDSRDAPLAARVATDLLGQATSERVMDRIAALLPVALASVRNAGADRALVADAKLDEAQALAILGRDADAVRACGELAVLEPDQEPTCRCHAAANARRHRDALAPCEAALAIAERSWGADHPAVATAIVNLAGAVGNLGQYDRAIALAQRALAIDEAAQGADSAAGRRDLATLASALTRAGKYRESAAVVERAVAILDRTPGRTDLSRAHLLSLRSEARLELGDVPGGRRDADEALIAAERGYGPEHARVALYHTKVAQALRAAPADLEAALLAFRRAAAHAARAMGPRSEQRAVALQGAADVLIALERPAEATPLLAEAIAIAREAGTQPYNVAVMHATHGQALLALDDRAGARRALTDARALFAGIKEAAAEVEMVDALLAQAGRR